MIERAGMFVHMCTISMEIEYMKKGAHNGPALTLNISTGFSFLLYVVVV